MKIQVLVNDCFQTILRCMTGINKPVHPIVTNKRPISTAEPTILKACIFARRTVAINNCAIRPGQCRATHTWPRPVGHLVISGGAPIFTCTTPLVTIASTRQYLFYFCALYATIWHPAHSRPISFATGTAKTITATCVGIVYIGATINIYFLQTATICTALFASAVRTGAARCAPVTLSFATRSLYQTISIHISCIRIRRNRRQRHNCQHCHNGII